VGFTTDTGCFFGLSTLSSISNVCVGVFCCDVFTVLNPSSCTEVGFIAKALPLRCWETPYGLVYKSDPLAEPCVEIP
jgi:hypothetical protein